MWKQEDNHKRNCFHVGRGLLLFSVLLMLTLVGLTAVDAQEGSLQEADELTQQVIQLYQQGHYDEAIPLAERVLAIREETQGKTHPSTALALNYLATLYQAQGQYANAEPLAQRALRIVEAALGPTHPEVAINLKNLSYLYRKQEKYRDAEPLYQRALR
ncbi:MAG: tetratricopeptide repeat-containing protein, partial [Nitrospira sp.]|nr:tetratricopeptide repeat-containing protein [Nitrospira sp.]